MLFYYVRHGDPIYNPDSLTELGHEQARALAKRLTVHGLDKIYASTSNRAILTASYTAEALGIEPILLDFANEGHAWCEMTIDTEDGRRWLFNHPTPRRLLAMPEVKALGEKWYLHSAFSKYNYKKGLDRVRAGVNDFMLSLGYRHIDGTGSYEILHDNNDRVALFAHQGFATLFFSTLLDISYPEYALHFDMCTTGLTVVDFRNEGGIAIPHIKTYSNDSHIYKEGLQFSQYCTKEY